MRIKKLTQEKQQKRYTVNEHFLNHISKGHLTLSYIYVISTLKKNITINLYDNLLAACVADMFYSTLLAT